MEPRKRKYWSFELSSMALHGLGLIFLFAGCIGVVLQNKFLGGSNASTEALLAALDRLPNGQAIHGAALACQALEICAVPLFAFLAVEGAMRTSSYKKYFLRVLGLAVLCVIPYNLMMSGSLLGSGALNPVFSVVMGLVMLYFFRVCNEKKATHILVKAVAIIGAYLWSLFLGIAYGTSFVIIAAALWASRGKQNLQLLCGCVASLACSVISPGFSMLYIVSPLGLLAVNLYSGKRGEENRYITYLAYPAMMTLFWLITFVV